MRIRLATAMLIVAGLFLALGGVVSILAGCAPGERLGLVEGDICVCPGDPDAGADAAIADAAPAPDATPHIYSRLHLLGDSVMAGYGASDVAHQIPTPLAATYPGYVRNQCVGGRSFNFYAYDAARRQYSVNSIAGVAPVAPPPSEVWIELGINDHSSAVWSAADFGAAYAAFVDRLHIALPSARVYCQTIHRGGTALNSKGSSRDDYSAAIVAACTGKPGAYVVNGPALGPFVAPGDYYDSIHLSDSGQSKMAAAIRTAVGW